MGVKKERCKKECKEVKGYEGGGAGSHRGVAIRFPAQNGVEKRRIGLALGAKE